MTTIDLSLTPRRKGLLKGRRNEVDVLIRARAPDMVDLNVMGLAKCARGFLVNDLFVVGSGSLADVNA